MKTVFKRLGITEASWMSLLNNNQITFQMKVGGFLLGYRNGRVVVIKRRSRGQVELYFKYGKDTSNIITLCMAHSPCQSPSHNNAVHINIADFYQMHTPSLETSSDHFYTYELVTNCVMR
eukprot:GHVL01004186.1.p1 GENE.GHVL01004186.1~~GHVL01004186.1.p1  ORF type:complete len:120 (+),score=4.50 GHVL01004186.1:592-951(+)